MTPVKFEFLGPDGAPIANQSFEIKLPKSGFMDASDGVVMPDTLTPTTDADGTVTIPLAPSSTPYFLKMISDDLVEDECCQPGIYFKFYVPVLEAPVTEARFQDLIIDPPPSTKAYDEAALLIIINAKIHAMESAASALLSKEAAALSEAAAAISADSAEASQTQATESAAQALVSQTESKLSQTASKESQDAARASELSAAASAEFAAGATQDMQDQVDEATRQAGLSATSAGQSSASASAAAASLVATNADVVAANAALAATVVNKNQTAADVVAVGALKTDVTALKDQTKIYRDETEAFLGTITGTISDGGPIDMSGGVYPPKPIASTVWRVTVDGVVGAVDYKVGDQLFYTKATDVFYKVDGTENVHSVAGRKGDVVLVKGDVGLGLVDNTADVNKPISTPQAAAFAVRTPTTSQTDVVAGHLVKVGDYGENGGPALTLANTADADLLAVSGTYLFSAGGAHLPEASVYLKHMPSGTAGQAKQLAWGMLTDKTYVRTQVAGLWTAWAPATEIIDNLTSTDANKALSAKQGKVLYDLVQSNNATIVRYVYNVAQGQTAISGADINGKTLSYVPGGSMLVNMAGVDLWLGDDFTASNGSLLTLMAGAETVSQMSITVFGSFSVADHYTKAEDDALMAAMQAQINRLYSGTYIQGLDLEFVSGTSLKVLQGSAWVPGTGQVTLAADLSISTGLILAAQAIHYAYLTPTGTIEVSLTSATKYAGTAYSKTGDTSRRLIGMYFTLASVIYPFMVTGSEYIFAKTNVSNFLEVVTTGTASAATLVNIAGVAPVNATALNMFLVLGANTGVALVVSNTTFTGAADGLFAMPGQSSTSTSFYRHPLKPFRALYYSSAGQSCFIRISSFNFER